MKIVNHMLLRLTSYSTCRTAFAFEADQTQSGLGLHSISAASNDVLQARNCRNVLCCRLQVL